MKRTLYLLLALLALLAWGALAEAPEIRLEDSDPMQIELPDGAPEDQEATLLIDDAFAPEIDMELPELASEGLDLALDGDIPMGDALAGEEEALAGNSSTFTAGDYEYTVDSGLASISKYNGTATTVTLPTSVTFNGVTYRVTKVGREAFMNAEISTLTIPATINDLERDAFTGCKNLESVTINGNINDCYIDYQYSSDTYYTPFSSTGTTSGGYSVTFGNGVTRIPSYIFLPYHMSVVDNAYAHITSVTIPDTVTEIGVEAFIACYDLMTINWGANVKTIGESAFNSCSKLTTLSLPGSVTSIGAYGFEGCTSLQTLVLPASVNKLGSGAFRDCVNLTSVTVNGNIQDGGSYTPGWFYNTGTSSGGYSVTFGSGVTAVPRGMFFSNRNKTDVKYAHVTSVSFADTVKQIGYSAFQDCYDLKSIKWSAGLQKIDEYAFAYIDGLEELNLPASLTTVGNGAFRSWSKLRRLTLPNKTNYLGENAFRDCVNLTGVVINGTIQQTSSNYPVFYNTGTSSGGYTVTFGDSVKTVPAFLFYTNSSRTENAYAHVTKVTVGKKVTWINDSAFKNCYDLASVSWGNVTKICESAFAFDESLTELVLPATVYNIENYAFKGCSGVEKLVLQGQKSLMRLGGNAFADCTDLRSVKIDKNIEEFTSVPQAFYNTGTASGGYTVTFGSNAKQVPANLFYASSGSAENKYAHVTKVTLPDSVKEIRYGAFENCYDLGTVSIGKGVTKIGQEAFRNCESLTRVKYAGSKGMWKAIDIDDYNDGNAPLHQVKITCAMKGVDSITLNKYNVELLKKGKSATLKATVKPSNAPNKAVKWTSSDKNVAKVNSNGKITAVGNGVCTITAVSKDDADILKYCTVIVDAAKHYTIALDRVNSNGTDNLNLGMKAYVVPVFANKLGSTIESYSSSNTNVAYFNSDGRLTLYHAGKAKLTATARNGKKAYININVIDPKVATKVTLNKSGTVNLKVGKTLQLKATLTPKTAVTTLTWSSSNTAVATVSSKGKVTAKKTGTATITVKTSNGKSAKVIIKVVK